MNLNYRILKPVAAAILSMLCIMGVTRDAKASHLAAADIFLTYVGEGADGCSTTTEYKYLLTVDVYRACEVGSIAAPTSARITWGSENAGISNNFTMTNFERDTLEDLCEAFRPANSCIIPANEDLYPAYVRHRFTDTIILPSAQTDWKFSWTDNARNQAITNLSTKGSIYVECGLNNVFRYNNSTPRFLIEPIPYLCADQTSQYLNGPYDPNLDSMYTIMQRSFSAPNTQDQYAPGYTLQNPIGSTTPFIYDPATGSATFTPGMQGKYVLAFRCDEYDRKTKTRLGYTMRDVQVSVFDCDAPPPYVDTLPPSVTDGEIVDINGKPGIIACPGNDIEFSMSTKSENPTSQVYLSANTNMIPGSQFTPTGNGTSSASGVFEWTPNANQIGEYTLIIESKDSTCSGANFAIVLRNYTVILLKIVEGLNAGPDLPFCEINTKPTQLYVNGSEDVDVTWSILGPGSLSSLSDPNIGNPLASPDYTTTYLVQSEQLKGQCKSRDTITLYVDTSNSVDITPKNPGNPKDAMVLCRPGYVQLEALLKGRPPKNNTTCGIGQPTLCNDPDSAVVFGSSLFGEVSYDTVDKSSPVLFNNLRSTKQQFLVRRKDMEDADIAASTIRSLSFVTANTNNPTYEYSNFRILVKCTEKDGLRASDGFENFGMTQVFSAPTITFEDGPHEFPFTLPYSWDTTKNLIVQICYSDNVDVDTNCGTTSKPPVIRFVATSYSSGLILAAADETVASVCGAVQNPNIEEVLARPMFSFKYCEVDPLPFEISWDGEYMSDTTIEQPLVYVPKTARYVASTVGRSGCIMRDTLDIYVPQHDFKLSPEDTAICFGEGMPLSVYNGAFYKWYEYDADLDEYNSAENSVSCIDCAEPFVKPSKTTTYRIVVSDSVFCYDTLQAKVRVMPLPATRILNRDTTIQYGQSFRILATGARTYSWSPVSSLNNPNIAYPIATPKEDTRYIVGGIGANGCKALDTLNVTVNGRDNLFVPSAFSPNGDGKNDVFRVTNLTFQRIMEFRVFNRWGQEVYNTSSSTTGWDGTWKGVPQDVGNYSYLIRVGYPDGFVETYKGEVTLIR